MGVEANFVAEEPGEGREYDFVGWGMAIGRRTVGVLLVLRA